MRAPVSIIALLIGTVIGVLAAAVSGGPGDDDVLSTATRGITGAVTVRVEGAPLRARPDLGLEAPMLVRIVERRTRPDGATDHDLEYIGTIAGFFDLRDVLERVDGAPAADLPPIPVEIVSYLPANAPTDVFAEAAPAGRLVGGYRQALVGLAIAWALVPVFVFVVRRLRGAGKGAAPEPAPSEPTLADQLDPLVAAAARRELSVAEQGRLELLLYAHWQADLELADQDRPTAVARLRRHPEAGRLLLAVEAWLHRPLEAPPGRSEITALLAPYRRVPAIDTGGLA